LPDWSDCDFADIAFLSSCSRASYPGDGVTVGGAARPVATVPATTIIPATDDSEGHRQNHLIAPVTGATGLFLITMLLHHRLDHGGVLPAFILS
jgi:hypothetical protein